MAGEVSHGRVAQQRARPRFSTEIEPEPLKLPPGMSFGPVIATVRGLGGDLYVLHQPDWDSAAVRDPEENANGLGGSAGGRLPPVVRFDAEGNFLEAWGGDDHVPRVDGVSQWPAGLDGINCDDEGNLWIFGWAPGDTAMLKFSPDGVLLLRVGQREDAGRDDDTSRLDRPTSCYHDVATHEVFVSDGYGNHRIIAFNGESGEYTRMWGAYGKEPASLSDEGGYGNPVHRVAVGPKGRIYVCDRIKGRVQEFERISGGARFLREVMIAPGTGLYGSAFDLAFPADERFMFVADGSNNRVWTVGLEEFEVLGWASTQPEGDDNAPAQAGLLHRFAIEPNGDLLLACTAAGVRRMKFVGLG